ncbi:MAG: oligopeptide ABC transporter permease [Armatimonadota bacterium]
MGDRPAAAARPWRRALGRFLRHRLALVGGGMLAVLTALAVGAPWVAPHDPYRIDLSDYAVRPGGAHPLGTDLTGRDVLSRLIFAARVSLSVGIVAVAISTAVGTVLGAVAGYYGGRVDGLIMRLTDIILSFPILVIIITIVAVVGPSIYNVLVVIGLLGWPVIWRIVRGMMLSQRAHEYVEAARAVGAADARIIFRHLLPNTVAPIVIAATYGMATAILLEASLSFLGMGVQPPTASWGNMLNDAQSMSVLARMPWMWVPPGLAIAISVLSINLLGDGLRDALDPRVRIS